MIKQRGTNMPNDTSTKRSTYQPPRTRLRWNKERLAVVFATTVLTLAIVAWFMTIFFDKLGA